MKLDPLAQGVVNIQKKMKAKRRAAKGSRKTKRKSKQIGFMRMG